MVYNYEENKINGYNNSVHDLLLNFLSYINIFINQLMDMLPLTSLWYIFSNERISLMAFNPHISQQRISFSAEKIYDIKIAGIRHSE